MSVPTQPHTPKLPITTLSEAIAEIEKLIDNMVYHWDQLLFEKDLRDPIKKAWEDLKKSNEMTALRKITDSTRDLHHRGLTGHQRTFKLTMLSKIWKKFDEFGGVWLLKKLLEIINVLLDSIPGSEPLKEFKEYLEAAIVD